MSAKDFPGGLAGAVLAVFLTAIAAPSMAADDGAAKPFVKTLPPDSVHYVPLLEPPASRRLESGCVAHQPGKSGRVHSTGTYEEMLVVLHGEGELVIPGGESLPIEAGQIAYVPPHTAHFVRNTGNEVLQYVFIVTDTEGKPDPSPTE